MHGFTVARDSAQRMLRSKERDKDEVCRVGHRVDDVDTDISGGEEGIRTLDTLLTYTPLAGERLRPLGHLSGAA